MRVALLLLAILIAANAVSRPAATHAERGGVKVIDLQLDTPAPPDPASLQRLMEFADKSWSTAYRAPMPKAHGPEANLFRRNDI